MKKLFIIPVASMILLLQTVNGQTSTDGDNPKSLTTTVVEKQETMTQVLDALQTTDDDAAMVIAPLAKLNDLVKKVLDLRTQATVPTVETEKK